MIDNLNTKIHDLRCQRRMRQDHLAAQIGVGRSTMCAYENGSRRPPYETLIVLADIFKVSTDYLLGRDHARLIDAGGLTDEQYALVSSLVELMTRENKRLEDCDA
ncbi:MAG: helix-turn-helix transcriptional regulator [Ruminococcaceae bacterium]|nr:helix-turn-helix transcriptional regulator [Oscillospiraceae bacterium]